MTGGRDKPARRIGPGGEEAAPDGILPAGAPEDAGRVRRPAELMTWLRSQGAAVRELAGDRRARLEGTLADGTQIQVRLSGRDTRGSGLPRRLWALVRLQPAAAGHIAISSRAQLEQLALTCSLARQAGVPCLSVLMFGQMPGETLVLVTTVPPGDQPVAR